MPVLGADPEQAVREWDESPTTRSYRVSRDVYDLEQYFAYHPRMLMTQRHNGQDKAILNRLFATRLKQGYSIPSLKNMVDRFYQSWAADSEVPALTFSSTVVQDVLRQEADVVKSDPYLNWMLMGMPDTGPMEDPKGMRKAVLLYAGDMLLQYPEKVADVLRKEADVETTGEHLSTLRLSLRPDPRRRKYETVQLAIASIPLDRVTW